DRFLALLDQLLQQAEKLLVGERLLALALRLEVGVLERGIDQAQRRYPALVAGFHRVFQGGVDLVAQHGYGLSQGCARLAKVEPASTGGAAQDLGLRCLRKSMRGRVPRRIRLKRPIRRRLARRRFGSTGRQARCSCSPTAPCSKAPASAQPAMRWGRCASTPP